MQPTDKGEPVSWISFHRGYLANPRKWEQRTGFTVFLTDVVTEVIKIARSVDRSATVSIAWKDRLLFPDFGLRIGSSRFSLLVEKFFAGGAHIERVFNHRVRVTLATESDATFQIFQQSLDLAGIRVLPAA